MSMSSLIRRAAANTTELVTRIDDTNPDTPTPCSEWSFGELANHLTQFLTYSAAAARRSPAPDGDSGKGSDHFTGGADWSASFASNADDLAAAWADEQAYEGVVQFGPGELPAEYAAAITLMELVVHGWDLAAAAGADYSVDDDIAAAVEEIVGGSVTNAPQGFFGSPVPVGSHHGSLTRAIAMSGRDPMSWSE